MSAVVLAYHELGYVALEALLRRGVAVSAVFTYEDDPEENCWFRSVAALARAAGVPTYVTERVNDPEWVELVRQLSPDLLFSFHYRHLLRRPLRALPRLGAFNLHTSLLPRFRGRCPLNWQLVQGELRSGVTLHHMVARADAGDIVDQEPVAVGPDDTALELYRKLLPAAERLLERRLDQLLAGTAPRRAQDETQATTFGGRRPEDGRIDWRWSAQRIHDLVRAVAPPWPGAFAEGPLGRIAVHRTRRVGAAAGPARAPGTVVMDARGAPLVHTGEGLLELVEYQMPGGVGLAQGVTLCGEECWR